MKILYDHQSTSRQKYGGISRYFYEVSNRIPGLGGDEVEIFAPVHVNGYFYEASAARMRGWKIPHVATAGYAVKSFNSVLSRLLLPNRKEIDLFHETYYTMSDCCPKSARRVITVYDMIHEKFPSSFSRWDRTREIKKHAVHRADHIICISQNTKRDLIDILGVAPAKISVVNLGHSLMPHTIGGAVACQIDRPFILYVGGRSGYKNFEALLKVFAQSPMLRNEFSLVCFGGGRLTARETSLIRSLAIEPGNVIHLTGGDGVLAGLYSAAAALVVTSLYEGFGLPPLEAMSFDCPVVCANASSLPEVVGDAAQLFDPVVPTEMAAAIERVVSLPGVRSELIRRGQEQIKRFSWAKCARETLDVYQLVLHDHA